MISVIIPVYNYAQYLLQAFLSVVNECDDMEIIIVDDGSTDDIKMVIDKISRPFAFPEKIIRFISLGSNRGVSIARNAGLRMSEGKYITFLDADDMRVPGSILAQKMYLDNHENVDVVFGEALEIRGDIKYSQAINRVRKFRIHPSEVNPQTVMYRRTVFEKYGGWYEGLISGEDKEMSIRLGIHPESPFKLVKAKKLKAPMAFYRKHPNEKHKLRKADSVWNKETKRIQKDRIIQLKREGITRENTCFPI
jgi:glycosyltransferase involved in cell wall biosynthesis